MRVTLSVTILLDKKENVVVTTSTNQLTVEEVSEMVFSTNGDELSEVIHDVFLAGVSWAKKNPKKKIS